MGKYFYVAKFFELSEERIMVSDVPIEEWDNKTKITVYSTEEYHKLRLRHFRWLYFFQRQSVHNKLLYCTPMPERIREKFSIEVLKND